MLINMIINGKKYTDDIRADLRLMDYLRDKGFYSVKCGCDTSNCGLCTVWMDGTPVLSCSVLAARAGGHEITTLEGLEKEAYEFAVFMAGEGAEQCGYCSPGFVMNVLAMKKEFAAQGKIPTEEEIKHYLAGNLCRCTGYMSQMRAVTKYLKETKAGVEDEADK